jgi:hypothetical protein
LRRWAPAFAALTLIVLLFVPSPASARDIGADDEVVITGTVRVPRGEHADRILIADGRVEIEGTVDGVVIALNAPVHIGRQAEVDGDVIALSQPVTLEPGAQVNNDLVYVDEKPVVPRRAVVFGEVRRLGAGDLSLPFGAFIVHAAIWLAFTLSSLALGLALLWLAPGAAHAAFAAARERTGPTIAWGIGLFIGLPVVAVAALLTLVGIPLGVTLLLALFPFYALGYVATGYVLGRAILTDDRGKLAAFLAGWGILRAVAFIPGIGAVAWLGATAFGLGTLTVALWRSRGPAAPVGTAGAEATGAG